MESMQYDKYVALDSWYPWDAEKIGDISASMVYMKVEAPAGSYTAWLLELSLKKRGSKVQLYTGVMPIISSYHF